MNVSEIAQNTGGLDSSTFTHGGARQFDFCDVFMNVSEITQNTGGLDSSTFKYLQTENRPFPPMVRKFL